MYNAWQCFPIDDDVWSPLPQNHGLDLRAHGLPLRAHGLDLRAHGLSFRAHGFPLMAHRLSRKSATSLGWQ